LQLFQKKTVESQSQLVLENSVLFCPFLGRFKGGSFLGRQKNHGPQSFSQQLIFERYPTWLEAFPKGNSSSNPSDSSAMLVSGMVPQKCSDPCQNVSNDVKHPETSQR